MLNTEGVGGCFQSNNSLFKKENQFALRSVLKSNSKKVLYFALGRHNYGGSTECR